MIYMSVGIAIPRPPPVLRTRTISPVKCCGCATTVLFRRIILSWAVPVIAPRFIRLAYRNILGMAVQPDTGAIWACEAGPNGGDEINIFQPGKNYGWPVVSFGRFYLGPRVTEKPWQETMERRSYSGCPPSRLQA